VRMAGVAFDLASTAFAAAYAPDVAERMEGLYLRRLIRADLAAQLHRAVERHDPDLPLMLRALIDLLAHVPETSVIGAEDAVRIEVIDPLGRRMHELAVPARRAFLDLAIAAASIDHGLIRSILAKSKRWPLRVALTVPVIGRPFAIAALDAWSVLSGTSRGGDAR
jgi:hypothetical protein